MRRQDGFTMIEVIVGILLVTLVVAALSAMLVKASSSSLASQRQANLVEVAQAQIDKVHQIVSQYGFTALALNAYPANGEPLEVDTMNGKVTPKVTSVAAGGATATIWTFVTKATIGCNSVLGACAADDARRVIVAAKLSSIGNGRRNTGPNNPIYLSTVIANPVPSNQSNSSTGIRIGLNIG